MTEGRANTHRTANSGAIAAIVVFSLYYLSYRYPLEINSSTTSQNYSDTPISLRIGKYVVICILAVYVFFDDAHQNRDRSNTRANSSWASLWMWALVSIVALALLNGLVTGSSEYLELSLVGGVAMLTAPAISHGGFDNLQMARVFHVFAILVIVMQCLQVWLYITQGRLPALAYEGSVSIRFGSLWDDPNGIGIVVPSLVVLVVATKMSRVSRATTVLGLIFVQIATLSITGWALLILIPIVDGMTQVKDKKDVLRVLALIITIAAVAGALFVRFESALDAYIFTKSGSIGARLDQWELFEVSPWQFLFGTQDGEFIESGWLAAFRNLGILGISLYVLGAIGALRMVSSRDFGPTAPFNRLVAAFLWSYILGSITLRLDAVFPINLLYLMFATYALAAPAEYVNENGSERKGLLDRNTLRLGARDANT